VHFIIKIYEFLKIPQKTRSLCFAPRPNSAILLNYLVF